jgi:hypothetical protein
MGHFKYGGYCLPHINTHAFTSKPRSLKKILQGVKYDEIPHKDTQEGYRDLRWSNNLMILPNPRAARSSRAGDAKNRKGLVDS